MLQDNLKRLREQRGFSQAEVAEQLHVVRQTVSKWEKGLSAPDADMLVKLAAVLEVSASDLIGEEAYGAENIEDLALQTSVLNEQLAIQNRRIDSIIDFAKRVGLAALFLILLGMFLPFFSQCTQPKELLNPYFTNVNFILDGETKLYQINALPDDPNCVSEELNDSGNLAIVLGVPLEDLPSGLDPSEYADDPDSMRSYLEAFAEYVTLHDGVVISYEYWDVRPDGFADEPYLVIPVNMTISSSLDN